VFGDLLGFLGILLAAPLAAVLKAMVGEAVERYRQSYISRPVGSLNNTGGM
jgi:predicted PurR-regulated permease PerM